ncbi:MAG: 2-thiouracil desulfurase family protein [Candidatus Bathyarchaeia archaeon]
MKSKKIFENNRGGKLALVAHCILNQNSRVFGLAERPGIINEVMDILVRNDVGVIQMVCPELAYAGLTRTPKTREQYDNLEFRGLCRKIAEELARQVSEYKRHGIKLKIIMGVDGSPSCGVKDSGILIEELRAALDKNGILAPFCDVDVKNLKRCVVEIEKLIG